MEKDEYKLVCSKCGGSNIQCVAWVDPNTDELIEYWDGDPQDNWCIDCDDNTKFNYVKEKE